MLKSVRERSVRLDTSGVLVQIEIGAEMKLLGIVILLLAVLSLAFAVLAHSELRAAATAATPPTPNAMPLNRIVGPELFDPGQIGLKPAELAGRAMNRIYAIGAASLVLFGLGAIVLMSSRRPIKRSEE